MLLTSGQVSLAISSFIVFFFTTALFLSGYVLQQQTVRDLRAAIQPQLVKPPPTGPDLYLPPQFRDKEYWEAKGVVEAMVAAKERARAEVRDGGGDMGDGDVDKDMVGATRWQKKRAREEKRKKLLVEDAGETKEAGLRAGEAEKDEEGMVVVGDRPPSPGSKEQLTAAERRRRIKEQIVNEGEGESFKGYRRRMW